ncbi:MAG: glycosyltransferase family 4 protein [Solirubrobacterales bacterium]|nr:glycosyltransferase family 4 protein [Solirubrobacterales bacterium]
MASNALMAMEPPTPLVEPLRIAQVATLAAPVGPDAPGSIESMVWLLAQELTRLGHEVTVFGADGSRSPGELVTTLPGTYAVNGSPGEWYTCEWVNMTRAVEQSWRFDVMHMHAYLWSLPLTGLAGCPLVHTTHVLPYDDEARLRELYPDALVTALSHAQWRGHPELAPCTVVPHGLDLSRYTLSTQPQDYLCYLGRFIDGKGPLEAIATARALGMRLVMAGPRDRCFTQHVEPLVDNDTVEYVGFVDPPARDALLGGARALLYPVKAPEPFGLVIAEAMACGTPVAAIALGAAPELVEDGLTGALASSAEELPGAVERCLALDRRRIAEHARARFGAERMAADYLEVYSRAMAGAACLSS